MQHLKVKLLNFLKLPLNLKNISLKEINRWQINMNDAQHQSLGKCKLKLQ